MNVLPAEKNIGITTFLTNVDGVGGKLRSIPEDFIVTEISNYPSKKENGRFTIADVTSTNWETNLLVKEISNRLHISRKRVGFAGTKDKRAKTTQLMSFYNVPVEKLSSIKIKDVSIKDIYTSDKPVKIGNLVGNKFEITVRNIRNKIKDEQVQNITKVIVDGGGFPNFYGIQRFGIMRPITHVVGKHIVRDDFEGAAMTYVANPIEGEDEETYNLRKNLEETRDFSEALKSYPRFLNFEKAIMNKLVVEPDDFVGGLKELPRNLLTMFVYAYQSYLFNKILSERIRQGLPLNKAVVGDIILPVRKGILDDNGIMVKESNIEKVNKQALKGKAVISGVLFGCESVFSTGVMGEIEHKIIESEKIDHRDFIIPEIPYISSSGSRRALISPVNNLEYKLDPGNALVLKFELKKGCYATSLLREFMKTDSIRNY